MKSLLAFTGAAMALVLMGTRLALADDLTATNQTNVVEGLVVPDNVHDRQPFSFAVTQNANQAKVNVQTVDGVVVQSARSDQYGRVFLAAGLAAGAYVVSLAGRTQPAGNIEVKPGPANLLPHPRLMLHDAPQAIKLSSSFSLKGQGFSPNFADMAVILADPNQTQKVRILAATEDQLKLAPVSGIAPGPAHLTVANGSTRQSSAPQAVLVYDVHATLTKQTVTSGVGQTQVIVKVEPANVPASVRVKVLSGPVNFGGGRKEAEGVTHDGQAIFPVYAEPGKGPFRLAWDATPLLAATTSSGTSPTVPQEAPSCTCTATGGGIANLKAKITDRPAPKDIDVSATGNEAQQADWQKRRKDRPMFDDYLGTLEFTFDINQAAVTTVGEGHIDVKRTVKLKQVVLGGGLSFEIFREGRGGKWLPIDSREDNKRCECPSTTIFNGVKGEKYRVEIWRSRMAAGGIPTTAMMTIQISDTIVPCGFDQTATESYRLHFKPGALEPLDSID